jgi:hypothetical protein
MIIFWLLLMGFLSVLKRRWNKRGKEERQKLREIDEREKNATDETIKRKCKNRGETYDGPQARQQTSYNRTRENTLYLYST